MQSLLRKTDTLLEHPAASIFFVLFFPLFIEFAYSDFVRESELNSRVGWFILILAAIWVFRNKFIPYLMLGIFLVSGFMDSLYATTFGGVFTSASFEAMALTDRQEAVGFLQTYASFENLSLAGFYIIGSFYLLKKSKIPVERSLAGKVIIGLGMVMLTVLIYRLGILHKYYDTIPGFAGTLPSYYAGHDHVAKEIEARRQFVNASPVVATVKQADKKQTYLVIIGESLTRRHMGIYGYGRNTTPKLDELSDELIVQTNTISNYVQTQPSLRHALTQIDADNKMPVGQALSLVDIANKAGFKTWWISNQQPLRSTISAIANMADETHYISNDYHGVQVRRFDELMLPSVEKALNDDAEQKVIFVHLMGSHLQYRNRYPEAFSTFSGRPISGYEENLSARQVEYINSYDNSVLYTDHVVATMINQLKQVSAEQISAAVFFSDHGEEVFDNKDFVGHGPDSITPNMVEIPFITWTSAQYRQSRPAEYSAMKANQHQPFALNDDFHFVSGLIGIDADVVHDTQSLTSSQYAGAKRMVYRADYDFGVKRQ